MIRLPAALCFRRGGAAGLAPVLSRGLAEDVAIRRKDRSKNYKFVDKVAIEVSGGKGGNGCVSFETLGPGRKRPDGGNGGKGGDVYVIADKSMTSFTMKTFHFNGGPGAHGSSAGLTGRRGKDVVITVPCGTLISERVHEEPNYGPFNPFDDECADSEEGDEDEVEGTSSEGQEEPDDDYEDEDDEEEGDDDDEGGGERLDAPVPRVVAVSEILLASQLEAASRSMDGPDPTESLSARELFNHNRKKQRYNRRRRAQEDQQGEEEEPEEGVVIDMDVPGVPIRLAEGGRPGVGNQSMGGTGLRRAMSVPKTKMPGRMGDRRSLMFELKLIADVGLVGFPNAGKSSLLKALSNAQPKIAAYAFTTLHPNIGVVEYSDTGRITMADIPGLIEGAHDNRGLGHDFLRHIVRTQALLYVIDGAGTEGREPAADLHCLVEELRQYDSTLLEKPSFVFCNKAEINGTKVRRRRLADAAASYGMLLLEGSALKGIGLGPVADELRRKVEANRRVLHPEK